MADVQSLLGFLDRDSVVHRLTGTSKLVFFLTWSVAVMCTFDTRLLVPMLVLSIVIFRLAKLRPRDVRVVAILAGTFLVLNVLFVYLFAPQYGCEIYGTTHVLLQLPGQFSITAEELFYLLNMALKVVAVIPTALTFFLATNPSEFASSLNRIGVSYRVSYAVALALRYIPDLLREYRAIAQAQQARGIDLSSKDSLLKRLKNSVAILFPLILSSLHRIEVVANAMELRSFGKHKKRTWYRYRPFAKVDWAVMAFGAGILILSLALNAINGGRFYNPFTS